MSLLHVTMLQPVTNMSGMSLTRMFTFYVDMMTLNVLNRKKYILLIGSKI